MTMNVVIPSVLAISDDYLALTVDERQSMLRRLANIYDIASSLALEQRRYDAVNFTEFLQELEVDVSVYQEYDTARAGGLTRFLTHDSWKFDADIRQMHAAVSPSAKYLIEGAEPGIDATLDSCWGWYKALGEALLEAIAGFEHAVSFSDALSCLTVIDILFGKLLVACYLQRLNPHL